jgi:hypothetical protein
MLLLASKLSGLRRQLPIYNAPGGSNPRTWGWNEVSPAAVRAGVGGYLASPDVMILI